MRKSFAGLALCAAIAAGAATQPLFAAKGHSFAEQLLEHHNVERGRVGAPPLAWSARLASDAKAWADHLARLERMEHASNAARRGAGENLWMGSAGYYGADVMVGAFIEERKHYRPGVFPNVSRTGNWRDVGHYTQVIWGGTKEVGCAVSKGRENDFLVCRYWPAGNTYGQLALAQR